MRRPDWNTRKMAAFEKALGAFRAGRPHLHHLRESTRCELKALRAAGVVESVQILGCDDSCPACAALAGRIMTIAEALETVPLPGNGCTHRLGKREGWCRCEYVAVIPK